MLHCIAYGLAIAVLYGFAFYFLAGMCFGIWLLFWSVVFKDWNEQ